MENFLWLHFIAVHFVRLSKPGTSKLWNFSFYFYIEIILNKINNLTVYLIPIENNFYGHSVTVSGLLTGQDIINQLKSKNLGNEVWLSHRILNDERICTLDDMTLDDISNQLNCNIKVSEDSFKILLEGIAFG